MRKLLFLAAFSFSLTAHAQATPDAGANINPEARGPATVTDGRPNRRSVHKEQPGELGVPPKVPQPVEREVLGPREK
jgi:hypothetical protein